MRKFSSHYFTPHSAGVLATVTGRPVAAEWDDGAKSVAVYLEVDSDFPDLQWFVRIEHHYCEVDDDWDFVALVKQPSDPSFNHYPTYWAVFVRVP